VVLRVFFGCGALLASLLVTSPSQARSVAAEHRASATTVPSSTASPTPSLANAATATPSATPAAVTAEVRRLPPGSLYAILLNGGGRRESNFQSHLRHLQGMVEGLRDGGVAPEAITIFSGDGADPAADLATREAETGPGSWLLPRSGIGRLLRPPIAYVDSVVDGFVLRPATKAALRDWFAAEGSRLRMGDRLLLYVTDHGEKTEQDLTNNSITLWGEKLSVVELRELLALLDPGVQVVVVMSQCFSGSFANLALPASEDKAAPNVCGYFATYADRRAYGCYPENIAKDGVGHAHEFIAPLARLGRLSEVHRRVLVTDRTPDVPHTSADFYLRQLLQRVADDAGRELGSIVDQLLAEAWKHRATWESEIRLLDRIGHSFGSFSPRSLAELDQLAGQLPEFSERLATYAERWQQTFDALALENFRRFLDEYPRWRKRLSDKGLEQLDPAARRELTAELLADLVPFSGHDVVRHRRLVTLKMKTERAAAASYRAEVRLGVVLRMRTILTSIAGQIYVYQRADDEDRKPFERLVACEHVSLPNVPSADAAATLASPEPFPPLADEERLVESLMPAYMGIYFRPLSEGLRKRYRTARGAVSINNVNPDSPATEAGLKVSDIVLGPPGAPFTEPEQIREWTMGREIGVPATLDILREGEPMRVTLRPGPYPLALPKLPGPPKVGSTAPPLKVEMYPEARALAEHRPRLLFFWATWCTICKQALPELMAFAQARDVDVVAITDEDPEILEKFFREFADPFPALVATDPQRLTFQAYGVSGTPSFVLLDADGVVQYTQTGYRPQEGLRVEGWKWSP